MLLCARLSSGVRAALLLSTILMALGWPSRAAGRAPILETYDASLTTYQPTSATAAQDIRPNNLARGVGLDGGVRAGPAQMWAIAGNPYDGGGLATFNGVRLDTGDYAPMSVDLSLFAEVRWPIGRSFCGLQVTSGGSSRDSDGYQGRNWMQVSQPELMLYVEPGGPVTKDVLYLVYGADRYLEFQRQGTTAPGVNTFKGVNGAGGAVEYVSGSPETYIYYDMHGTRTYFFGGNTSSARADWQIWKIVDPAGNIAYVGDASSAATAVTSGYDASGNITTAYDSFGTDGRRFSYSYSTIDSVVRLTEVKAETKASGSWASPSGVVEVARVSYGYYQTGDNTYGDNGCLKLVTVRTALTDSGSSLSSGIYAERKTLYHYWTGAYDDNPVGGINLGHPYLIKLVVGPEGYRRYDLSVDSNLDGDPDSASTSTLNSFADGYFSYDSSRRVYETFSSGQCGCSGSPNGLHKLSYGTNGSFSPIASYDDEWKTRTIIEPPSGSGAAWSTHHFDELGQSLTTVQSSSDPGTGSPTFWVRTVERGTRGRVKQVGTPASIASYTHSTGSWTHNTSGQLVNPSTSISGAGAEDGYTGGQQHLATAALSPTNYADRSITYNTGASLTVGSYSLVRPLPASQTIYAAEQDVSGSLTGETTSFTYTMHSGSAALMPKKVVTTLPSVLTGHNGSGSSDTTERYTRADGTTAFSRTAKGSFDYSQFTDGLLVKQIMDAKTNDGTGDFASGDDPNSDFGITETGDGEKLVTSYTYDAVGRLDTTTLPTLRVTKNYYSRLADGRLVTVSIPAMTIGGSTTYFSPATYTVTNLAGKPEIQAIIAFTSGSTTSALTSFIDETQTDFQTSLGVGTPERMSTTIYDDAGTRVTETRLYFNIPGSGTGSDGTNYDATVFGYDDLGRRTRVKDATGTINRTVFDLLGRGTEQWVGTNDNGWTGPTGEPSGSNNMTKTTVNQYDTGGVGNGYLTKTTQDPDGDWVGTTSDQRVTEYIRDYRGRLILTKNPLSPHTVAAYDNLSRPIGMAQYSSHSGLSVSSVPTGTTNRIAYTETAYDELGRVYQTLRHEINQSTGASTDTLAANMWYDLDGRAVKSHGEQLVKTTYDRHGRAVAQHTLASTDDTDYADAQDLDGDIVLAESRTGYDATTGLALVTADIQRLHDDRGGGQRTGALDDTDGVSGDHLPTKFTAVDIYGRIQITAMWYDSLDRVVDTVAYGTHGIVGDGSTSTGTLDRAGLGVPSRSDTELRTTTTFNPDGSVLETTDPKGLKTRYLYDDAGRKTAVIANYVDGTPSGTTGADDVYTRFQYVDGQQTGYFVDFDGDNSLDSIDQLTGSTYGVAKGASAGDSRIASGRLLHITTNPDTESGESPSDYQVTRAYNALGQLIWMKDPAGNVIETDYDVAGRLTHRKVTTLGSGVDGAVLRISTTYNSRGMIESVTQYDDETPGSGSTLNDVKYSYDAWGNLLTYEEDRDSDVGGGTPNDYEVSYLYDVKDGTGRKTIRRSRQSIAYASTNLEWTAYNYLSSSNRFDDDASRVSELVSKSSVTYASYDYNGMSHVVGIEYPEPAVYRRLYGSSQGDYPDLDIFNRQVKSDWTRDLSVDVSFYDVDYSYDRNSNITWFEDNVYPGRDVLYTMDDLNRLTDADEGTRSGGSITSRVRREEWTLQQVGNWDLFKLDLNGDGDWSDTNEVQDRGTFVTAGGTGFNELRGRDTDNNSSVDIMRVYDKNGNLSDDGLLYLYKYDAFNRLRKLIDRDDGTTLVHEYTYNGVGHRIGFWNLSDNQWVYFAYDEQWRMVASYRTSDTIPKEIFINQQAGLGGVSLALGVDACVARLKDASTSWTAQANGIDERIYVCQELRASRADVMHLINTDGSRVESVRYSPYGVPFGIPYVDFNADGAKTSADQALLTAATGSSAGGAGYNVACDMDLDGVIGATDAALYSSYSGGTLGRGNMSRNIVRNRKGYAGYEHDGIIDTLVHVRHRAYEAALGRWVQRDPLGFVDGGSLFGYCQGSPVAQVDSMGTESDGPIQSGPTTPGSRQDRGVPWLDPSGYTTDCLKLKILNGTLRSSYSCASIGSPMPAPGVCSDTSSAAAAAKASLFTIANCLCSGLTRIDLPCGYTSTPNCDGTQPLASQYPECTNADTFIVGGVFTYPIATRCTVYTTVVNGLPTANRMCISGTCEASFEMWSGKNARCFSGGPR